MNNKYIYLNLLFPHIVTSNKSKNNLIGIAEEPTEPIEIENIGAPGTIEGPEIIDIQGTTEEQEPGETPEAMGAPGTTELENFDLRKK